MSGNIYAAIAVAAVEGIFTYSKLKAQKDALKNQAKIAQQNATMSDIQARNTIDQGRNQAEDYQRNISAFRSSQINALADNGIDVSEGSAVDILASTDMMAQADMDNIKYNAALQSWGYKVQETNYLNQKNSLNAQAQSVRPLLNSFMAAGEQFASMYGGGTPSGNPMQGNDSATASSASSTGGGQGGYVFFDDMSSSQKGQSSAWQNYNWNWFGSSA